MIYPLIRTRRPAATRVGRTYRIPSEDRDEFLTDQSTRAEVRDALFRRVLATAEPNPGLSGDAVLEELEQEDSRRQRQAEFRDSSASGR